MKRTLAQWIFYWIILVGLFLPVVPISMAWKRLRMAATTAGGAGKWTYMALAVQSLSLMHLAIACVYRNALGHDYSNLRYALIYSWIAVSASTLFAASARNQFRLLISAAGTNLLVDWLYILVVNSAV
jgi:hypothetical protein